MSSSIFAGAGVFPWPQTPSQMEMGWAPFNGPKGKSYLGDLDVAFLGSYAIGMFVAGELCPFYSWLPSWCLPWHATDSPSAGMAPANV